jgi:hypothetical protein
MRSGNHHEIEVLQRYQHYHKLCTVALHILVASEFFPDDHKSSCRPPDEGTFKKQPI